LRAELLSDRGQGLPVVYVPGIDGTGELLLGSAARLEERYRLLRLHYPTEPLDGRPAAELDSYERLAASCAEAIRGAGVERCVVVAESFGGAVALQLALDHPELVRGLIVVNSFVRFPAQARLWLGWKLSVLVPRFAFDAFRRLLGPWFLFADRHDRRAIADFQALWGTFFDEGYRRRMGMITRLDLRRRVGELAQPLMLLASTALFFLPWLPTSLLTSSPLSAQKTLRVGRRCLRTPHDRKVRCETSSTLQVMFVLNHGP
jgi:pimeloyl-ACP methyl ester carboxylesterase